VRTILASFVVLGIAALVAGTATAGTSVTPEVSSNWSGYAAISADPSTPASFTDVTDGDHTFTVAACDTAGNCDPTPVQRTFTIDTVPPTVNLTVTPPSQTNDATPSVQFTTSGGPTSVECRVDSGSFANCTSPFTSPALGDGGHSITVRATDAAGNSSSSQASFTVDTVAPIVANLVGPPFQHASTNANFSYTITDANVQSVQCELPGGTVTTCTSSSASANNLSEGSHTFTVRATDAAGNIGQTAYPFVVDTTLPVVTINAGPSDPTSSTSASFNFTVTEANPAFVDCKLDNTSFAACDSSSSQSYSGLSPGSHTFTVRATDAAGNGGQDTYTWTIN
jgi:hypothetical protein